jgi:hypothetical protein
MTWMSESHRDVFISEFVAQHGYGDAKRDQVLREDLINLLSDHSGTSEPDLPVELDL